MKTALMLLASLLLPSLLPASAAGNRAIAVLARRLPPAWLQGVICLDDDEAHYCKEEVPKFEAVWVKDNPMCGSCWGVAVLLVSKPNWKEIRREEVLDLGASRSQVAAQESSWGPQRHVWLSYFVSTDGTVRGTDGKSTLILNTADR